MGKRGPEQQHLADTQTHAQLRDLLLRADNASESIELLTLGSAAYLLYFGTKQAEQIQLRPNSLTEMNHMIIDYSV